jgi:hypothetical protein
VGLVRRKYIYERYNTNTGIVSTCFRHAKNIVRFILVCLISSIAIYLFTQLYFTYYPEGICKVVMVIESEPIAVSDRPWMRRKYGH